MADWLSNSLRKMTGIASTDAVDYDGEVVLPSAWKESLRAWKKLGSRPKFLAAHKHSLDSGHSPALGTIDAMEITEHGLVFEATFADTELGNEYLKLYDMKAMDAFSVGFLPREREFDAAKIQKILEKNGIKEPEGMPCHFITTKAHAMEVSCVVLGTNYEALCKSSDPAVLAVVKNLEGMGVKFDEKGCAHGECPGGDACAACAEKRLEKFDFNAPEEPEVKAEPVAETKTTWFTWCSNSSKVSGRLSSALGRRNPCSTSVVLRL